jgi:hypothetical protein
MSLMSCMFYIYYINQLMHWIKYIRELLYKDNIFQHRGAINSGPFNTKECKGDTIPRVVCWIYIPLY